MNRLVLYIVFLTLAACGGGGGSGGKADDNKVDSSGGCAFGGGTLPNGSISIKEQRADLFSFVEISSGVVETESPTVTLGGNVLEQTIENVEVTNSTTGETIKPTTWIEISGLGCPVGYWEAESMSLNVGDNAFTAKDGNDSDSITIRRVIDDAAPVVVGEFPAAGSTDAAQNSTVRATFDDFMDASTITAATVLVSDSSGSQVAGTVTYDAKRREVTFDPDADLYQSTVYRVRITTGVTDDVGNPLAGDHIWSFTTADDGTPPTRLLARPAAGAACIAPGGVVAARFDEPLAPASLTAATVVVEDSSGTPVAGTLSFEDLTLTFSPNADLAGGETYTVNLNDGITDYGGHPLAPESWTFSTEYAPEGTWTPISNVGIGARDKHTALWTGAEMLVFGGQGGSTMAAGSHGRYDPVQDQWRDLSTTDAPISRWSHTATWSGAEMIVWGGRDWNWEYNSGGRYDPVSDSWATVTSVNAPSARYHHSAVWTGTELIVWGGRRTGQEFGDGARYDPATDTWTAISSINAPSPRNQHKAVWDGSHMIVWGGQDGTGGSQLKDGAMYDPATDVWLALPVQNAPDPSKSGFLPSAVVATGTDMFVWSHWREFEVDEWTNVSAMVDKSEARRISSSGDWQTVVDACDSQAVPNAVWFDGRMTSWNSDLTEGYFYLESRDVWIPITPFAGVPVTDASVVATDDSIIVLGGNGGIQNPGPKNAGYRLRF